jgi:hypothetical protein
LQNPSRHSHSSDAKPRTRHTLSSTPPTRHASGAATGLPGSADESAGVSDYMFHTGPGQSLLLNSGIVLSDTPVFWDAPRSKWRAKSNFRGLSPAGRDASFGIAIAPFGTVPFHPVCRCRVLAWCGRMRGSDTPTEGVRRIAFSGGRDWPSCGAAYCGGPCAFGSRPLWVRAAAACRPGPATYPALPRFPLPREAFQRTMRLPCEPAVGADTLCEGLSGSGRAAEKHRIR